MKSKSPKYHDGQVIGSWTVLGRSHIGKWHYYICRCVCGTIRHLSTSHIPRRKACSSCDRIVRTIMATGKIRPRPNPEVKLDGSRIRAEEIRRAVAQHFNLSEATLVGRRKSRNVAWPRILAVALTRELTKLSSTAIGQRYGGRDHATILHGVDRAPELRRMVPNLDAAYFAIKNQLIQRPHA